ncbi:uncharacterized protein PFL1_00324 [Pseudozyma flocculosa PF-1]|uniref:Related to Salicylate hydroxylase n=1 Tax=Pseudozyma flocculosa TaxID=84751 RepID=A0A5C3ETS8_9BASI|nr:uncharacterized protein PFL1_00324 [Pseudozyma flocculosa PF-1]EPQ32127.1 hypothetical protein PFL1_00324 [Pseudozyma flocculosa PF-1]SPO34936.1 related to Salicylate hydroxylase [Pseudozyma flocculosa]
MTTISKSSPRLKVTVVGAGIAGLATARALREHHDVVILETSRLKTETGAAIGTGPNASRILLGWGVDLAKLESPDGRRIIEFNKQGDVLQDIKLDMHKTYGAPFLLNHRIALHRELKRLATSEDAGIPGKPAKLLTASKVVAVDCDTATVTLEDGSQIQGDVVVGADGIKSTVRDAVLGQPLVPKPSGHSAYRTMIPFDKLHALRDAQVDEVLSMPGLIMIVGLDRRLVAYTCRLDGQDLLNIVAIVPDAGLQQTSKESWSAEGDIKALRACYEGFCPLTHKILSLADQCSLYQLRDQDPFGSWTRGKAMIIGDAAHCMLPHLSQGGSQAIEDAEAIAYALQSASGSAAVEASLKRAERLRIGRATFAQEHSRKQALGPRPGTEEEVAGKNPMQFTHYLYDYSGAEDWAKRMEGPEQRGNSDQSGAAILAVAA